MKKISAWLLALCMCFAASGVCLAAKPGDEVTVGRDAFVPKNSGEWYTSDNASGMHYNNKGIVSDTSKNVIAEADVKYTLTADGEWELFWFYSGWTADTAEVTLTIAATDGDKTKVICTKTESERGWQSIGTYALSAGENTIHLKNDKEQARFSGLKAVYKSIDASSDIFTVSGSAKTVTGVLKGMTAQEVLENITVPEGCRKSVKDKSDTDAVTTGDKLLLEADGAGTAEYSISVDRDMIVSEYTLSGNTISQIPYNTRAAAFLKNIKTAKAVAAAVYTGEEQNSNVVLDGDKLVLTADGVSAEYTLSVEAASGNNTVESTVYTVAEDEISDIPYNTAFSEFKSNITIPKYATAKYPYSDDYTGYVYSGDAVTVRAQNGDEKTYTLGVLAGRSEAALAGSGEIEVKEGIISGVEPGTDVSELIGALSVSGGGKMKLYSANGEEITSGKISGGEIIKVFPEYAAADKACDIYVISANPKRMQTAADIIVTVSDDGFTNTGTIYPSGGAVEPGYNGITSLYPHLGVGTFTPAIPTDGNYEVFIYTSYHSSNEDYPATIYYDGGSAEKTVCQSDPTSGWKSLGTYKFAAGSTGHIDCDSTKVVAARLSAVKLVPEGAIVGITEISAEVGENKQTISEGVNSDKSFAGAKLLISTEAALSKEDITITSENGNDIAFTLEKDGAEYVVVPKYALREKVAYYVNVSAEGLSKPYTYVLMGKSRVGAAAQLRVSGGYATATIEIKNSTSAEKTMNILICAFSDALSMEECTVISSVKVKGTESTTVTGKVKAERTENVRIFIWDEEQNPVTGVYYR